MRLTLRTLLAWLDDTLPAAEVRQIGKQVAESTFAQELVDRTYRVTRQRRLLVPPSSGPDSTDPNVVSAYLDSELPPEDVAEYEKKCLTSDVNLAEVASVHQILSLIGQKAKVPPEAKHRMYRLIKGRESSSTRAARAFAAAPRPAGPVTPPLPTWSTPSATSRPMAERVGIAALVLVLLSVIGWTAVRTLSPDAGPALDKGLDRGAAPGPELASADPAAVNAAEKARLAAVNEAAAKAAASQEKSEAVADIPKPEAAPKAASGGNGVKLARGETLVVGWNAEKGDWVRLAETSAIKDGTRILNFAPFWTTFEADTARLILVSDTETSIASGDRKAAIKLGFDHGRAILRGGADGLPYHVTFAGKVLGITNAPGVSVGIARIWTTVPGIASPGQAPLVVYVPEGEVGFELGDQKSTVKGPGSISLSTAGELKTSATPVMPAWLGETVSSPSDKGLGDRFLKYFSPGGAVLRDLVQAVDGDDPDVRRVAILALGSVGDAEMIVPVLNNAMTDPATRRAAANVLRSMLAKGGDSAKAVRAELTKVFGAEYADDSEKLLVGYTPEEGKREPTYAELVKLLSSPELGTRELALHALMSLTGRDTLEYDPVKPEGRGLKAWQDLLYKKELHKSAPPPPPAPPR